jgi:hypothetical protein
MKPSTDTPDETAPVLETATVKAGGETLPAAHASASIVTFSGPDHASAQLV